MERDVYRRMAELEDRHWWFVARRSVIASSLRQSLVLPESAKVLEAGCGTGGNLEFLEGFGQVSSFEPDDEARILAARKSKAEVRKGHLPDCLPFEGDHFDLVVALDVLEHLEEDRESVLALKSLIKPGGHCFVTVPAYPFLWSEHDVRHHHKRRYRRKELATLLGGAGLELVKVSYFNTMLFPLVVAVRLAKKITGTKGADDSLPSAGMNAALRNIFMCERHFLPLVSLPFGLSLMALARKGS